MNKEVKNIYNELKKIIFYMNSLLKKEKLNNSKELFLLRIYMYFKNDLDINILSDEIKICVNENIESLKFLNQIKV